MYLYVRAQLELANLYIIIIFLFSGPAAVASLGYLKKRFTFDCFKNIVVTYWLIQFN